MTAMIGADIAAAFAALARAVRTRPLVVLAVALAMFATDLLAAWIGLVDAKAIAGVSKVGLAVFILAKLVAMLAAYIGFVRLAGAPGLPIGPALALDRRQAGWLALTFAMLLGLLGLMLLLKLAMVALVLAIGLPRALAGALAMIVYLVAELIVAARFLPGFAGVMIGDPAAGLGWSWARTRGRVGATILLIVTLIAPFQLAHIGLSLAAAGQIGAARWALMAVDGGAMALILAAIGAAHARLHARARTMAPMDITGPATN